MPLSTQTMIKNAPKVHETSLTPSDIFWRLSVDKYHEMISTGILTDDDPVELLEGWLIAKMPKNPPHRIATRLTYKALERIMPAGWYVDAQEPITTADSEPEPDVVVVRGDTRHYFDRHPGPEDLALVIEVSDATLHRDRTLKKDLYAKSMIPAYWVINLPQKQCEVYSEPTSTSQQEGGTYRQHQIYKLSDRVPLVIEGQEVGQISVRELLS